VLGIVDPRIEVDEAEYLQMSPVPELSEDFSPKCIQISGAETRGVIDNDLGSSMDLRINYTTVRSSIDPDIKVKLSYDDSFNADHSNKTRVDSIVDQVKQRIKQKPYEAAIKQLRMIQNIQSPSQKLECILETQNLVTKSIADFWEGVQVNRDKVALSADETIAIYIYIIVKARIKDLTSHMYLIENFCNEYTIFQSNKGFVFISMMQAADYLKDIDESKLKCEEQYLRLLIEKKRKDLQKRHQQYLNTTVQRRDQSFNAFANPNLRDISLVDVDTTASNVMGYQSALLLR
jgi:hypothetical protein